MTTQSASCSQLGHISSASVERAISEDGLALHYQPVVSLVDDTLTGFEALVRWPHPELGLLSASSFIAVAEQDSSLIRALDDWVLDTACRQVAEWQDEVLIAPGFHVAVNVSAIELDGARLLERVTRAVSRSHVDSRGLVIEVTESLAVESIDAAGRSARWLHEMGIELAIDDFGMRHSWFSRLHDLPFDVLKIDREFVQDASTYQGAAFVSALVTLGNALNVRIVAEGVETAEQARALRALGCHEGQGFFWAPAMGAPAATRLLLGTASMDADTTEAPWCPKPALVQ